MWYSDNDISLCMYRYESSCVCFSLQSEPTRVPPCHETAALSAAGTKLCNTEVYYCISGTYHPTGRSEQDECYGIGNCLWPCAVSVCLFMLACNTLGGIIIKYYELFFHVLAHYTY